VRKSCSIIASISKFGRRWSVVQAGELGRFWEAKYLGCGVLFVIGLPTLSKRPSCWDKTFRSVIS